VQLILVRHGLPARADDLRDPGLGAEGREQVDGLVADWQHQRIDAVWSSTMQRAVETADLLADPRGLSVRQHEGLSELAHDGPYVPLEDDEHPTVIAFWERIGQQANDPVIQGFRRCVVAAIDDVIRASRPEDVVVVACHGGVISAYASAVLGLERVFFFVGDYTGYSRFDVDSAGAASMVSLNEHGHLLALAAKHPSG